MTMAQLAIRWILDFNAVTVVIPGAKNPRQAMENTLPSDLPPLSQTLHETLRIFYEERVASYIRGPY
jgi:aryl-alcohol dehydrogenase-like predicted oxidoreductase